MWENQFRGKKLTEIEWVSQPPHISLLPSLPPANYYQVNSVPVDNAGKNANEKNKNHLQYHLLDIITSSI